MKPDWKDAPEWANWIALDSDLCWCWHEQKPVLVGGDWVSGGMMLFASTLKQESALEKRP